MAARTTAIVSFAIFFIFGVGCSWRAAVANGGSWGGCVDNAGSCGVVLKLSNRFFGALAGARFGSICPQAELGQLPTPDPQPLAGFQCTNCSPTGTHGSPRDGSSCLSDERWMPSAGIARGSSRTGASGHASRLAGRESPAELRNLIGAMSRANHLCVPSAHEAFGTHTFNAP